MRPGRHNSKSIAEQLIENLDRDRDRDRDTDLSRDRDLNRNVCLKFGFGWIEMMNSIQSINPAPRGFQQPQSWSRADKDGIGTARSLSSPVWYTAAHGIVTEVYFPDVDSPQIRDLQLIVTDGATFFHDAQRDFTHRCEWIDTPPPNRVPTQGLRLTNTAIGQPYTVVQEVIAEPEAACMLVRTTLEGDQALLDKLKVYVLLAPHMAGYGAANNAYVIPTSNGRRLVASRGNYWLALGADCGFGMTSCGFVGINDGWTDIVGQGRLPIWNYDSATDGYVALTAEIARSGKNQFVLALAFCLDEATPVTRSVPNAALAAVTEALSYPFDNPAAPYSHLQEFLKGWQSPVAQPFVPKPGTTSDNDRLFHIGRNVLLSHEDKTVDGALVASLSIPWGETVCDLACGYHLVWPRDMSQSATALLAAGEIDAPLRGLMFLSSSQSGNGGFHQKFFIDGQPWPGDSVQLDEYSFPIMLAYRLSQRGLLRQFDPKGMVLSAAGALIVNGPMTQQERWEENEGYSPSTLAANIASLVCAADLAANKWSDPGTAQFLLDYADFLESKLEKWCVTNQGTLVPDVSTYYIRLLPTSVKGGGTDYSMPDTNTALLWVGNNPHSPFPAKDIVDGGFLELVRYGIRSPHDPIIVNSVKVIDAILRDDSMPGGPCYHRYNNDCYGQGPNGESWSIQNSNGIGRPWPLLAGERGHYEVACGNDATPYLRSMEAYAGTRKLIPEQAWNAPDRTNPTFYNGGPTGSANPLAWAHAEYIRLVRSVSEGKVFDRLDVVADRYLAPHQPSSMEIWNFDYRPSQIKAGNRLRIPLGGNFRLRWTTDNWASFTDTAATPMAGIYFVDLATDPGQVGTTIQFTMFWLDSQTWLGGGNFAIALVA
jgi:glucoamylase